ncbi:hypothetical protein GWI33_005148 [Rhynchophorus ferrugineus]|uniref:Uncharacterized protein n=1 Tax=Rhynchophorus ferrugineus TaxID=354439 RepID=A0A834IHZ7_RHYFE|nr:hypothetical protein GWI33_005148 [Rhynchophorus ferrugineus]
MVENIFLPWNIWIKPSMCFTWHRSGVEQEFVVTVWTPFVAIFVGTNYNGEDQIVEEVQYNPNFDMVSISSFAFLSQYWAKGRGFTNTEGPHFVFVLYTVEWLTGIAQHAPTGRMI